MQPLPSAFDLDLDGWASSFSHPGKDSEVDGWKTATANPQRTSAAPSSSGDDVNREDDLGQQTRRAKKITQGDPVQSSNSKEQDTSKDDSHEEDAEGDAEGDEEEDEEEDDPELDAIQKVVGDYAERASDEEWEYDDDDEEQASDEENESGRDEPQEEEWGGIDGQGGPRRQKKKAARKKVIGLCKRFRPGLWSASLIFCL